MRVLELVIAKIVAASLVLAVAGAPGRAQTPGAPTPPPDAGPDFGRFLYPPDVIMRFHEKIVLKPEQRAVITSELQQLQSKEIELQWRMMDETQKLTEQMQRPVVNEAEALAQVDRVLAVERDIKRTHLSTLIRIKNTLTPAQQHALDTLRWSPAAR